MGLFGVIRKLVKVVVGLIVVVIVAGILLFVFDQNEPDTFTNEVIEVADTLVSPFRMLFELDNNDVQIALNFGIGALAWILLAAIVLSLLDFVQTRLARRQAAKREAGPEGEEREVVAREEPAPAETDDAPAESSEKT